MSTPTVPFYPMTHDDAQELISAVRTKDTSNLADVYDPTTTYDVGEFCVHNNMLYKCTTAISSPEAWTAAHWSSEKVCDNLQDTEQTDKIKSDIGIVEDGNVATHAISAGQYVIWKDELYMADDAISIGETLASSGGSKNLTAKPNGLGGEVAALNSKVIKMIELNNATTLATGCVVLPNYTDVWNVLQDKTILYAICTNIPETFCTIAVRQTYLNQRILFIYNGVALTAVDTKQVNLKIYYIDG